MSTSRLDQVSAERKMLLDAAAKMLLDVTAEMVRETAAVVMSASAEDAKNWEHYMTLRPGEVNDEGPG